MSSEYVHHPRITRNVLPRITDFEEIDFVSGPCLFSKKSVRAFDGDGNAHDILGARDVVTQAIVRIEADRRFSLYEIEAVARLCDTIEDMTGRLPLPSQEP